MLSGLLVAAVLAILAFEILKRIRVAFFHPLSNVPGPWYASLTDLWLSFHAFTFHQTYIVHELFQKYGPIVRVGPEKIAFIDVDAMRDIYLVQKFEKGPMYSNFKINGMDQSLTFLDNASHAARRKPSGPHYTSTNIARFQPEMCKSALELVQSLQSINGSYPVECLHLLRNFMLDIAVFSTFGYNLGALGRWTINVPDELSVAISDFPKVGIVRHVFPDWLWAALCYIPHKRWRDFTQCTLILKKFVVARIQELQHQIDVGKEFDAPPFIYRLLQYRTSSTNEPLPTEVVTTEGIAHLVAGTETSSGTLTYFLWQISCSPDIAQKLQTEIDNAMPDPGVIPDLTVLHALPYFNAFITEGFRVHGVVSALLERVVPPGENYNMMGYSIPPGTIVATQAWSLHRDPRVFPAPDTFDPERWLGEPDDSNRAAHIIPFGFGTRVCAGQQLAQAVMRIAVAAIIRNFTVQADSSTTKASMKMMHGFASFPTAGQCKLIFIPRKE
ncbi:cytochrome P450 [Mycena galericulata]|nr:cytochrome P450 [Mycena galericulata]